MVQILSRADSEDRVLSQQHQIRCARLSVDQQPAEGAGQKSPGESSAKGEPEAKKAALYLIGRQLMRRSEVEKITESWRASRPDELSPSAIADFIAQHARFAGREEELTKQATDWLKTKSFAALNRLYEDFLIYLPEGVPTSPLLAFLGTPNWWEDPHPYSCNFSSEEGPAVQVHLTTEGKLGGLRLQ